MRDKLASRFARFNYLASLLMPTTLLFGKYPTWAYEKKNETNID